jgi:hypothetical protein
MQFFRRQILRRERQTLTLGGNSYSWDLQRSSVLRQVRIKLEAVVGTVAATASIEAFPLTLKNITLQGTLNGQSYTPFNLLNGRDLFDMYQAKTGTLPLIVAAANQFILASTGYVSVEIPLSFDNPRFGAQRYLTCLDTRKMSDLTLTVTTASQADLDVHTTPTLVFTSINATVEQDQFEVETIPADFAGLKMQVGFREYATITTGQSEFQLPAGGLYSLIIPKSFASANTKQAASTTPASSTPFNTQAGAQIVLYDLNRRVKQQVDFVSVISDNINDVVDTLVPGNPLFLFNRGTNDLFYTGAIEKAESYVTLQADTIAATGAKIRFIHERIFDPANALGLAV